MIPNANYIPQTRHNTLKKWYQICINFYGIIISRINSNKAK